MPQDQDRLQKMEEALLEYIERYGLTDKARELYGTKERPPSRATQTENLRLNRAQ